MSAAEARALVERIQAAFAPLEREANRAAWDAATGGGEEASERATRARTELRTLFSDLDAAKQVRGWLRDEVADDPILRRQLTLLDLELTRNQLPRETIRALVEQQTVLERIFTTFRAELDGERMTDNAIREILASELDGRRRRAAWTAAKQIGAEVAEPLREYARRRNAAARELGFRDAYALDLRLQEIDEETLFATLDRFRALTDEPFRDYRDAEDRELAGRFGVEVDALRPWHWEDPYAQQAPRPATFDPDAAFRDRDPVEIATEFMGGIGLPVEEILARSDLYEREGKDQHAFCQDIDREGDVRILCNLRPNEKWMATLLHELGHAVYDELIPRTLPYLLRAPSHTLTTESVAMYFGRLPRETAWLRDAVGAEVDGATDRAIRAALRGSMLVSTRWMLVMVHFERELYRDPDRADLNRVWWELVERMQYIRHPEADPEGTEWATKLHLSLAPVYYHNYLLGELMASQVAAAVRRETGMERGASAVGNERVGAFFRERVFAPGASMDWNGLLVHATGEPLDARFFVEDFVSG